MVLVRNPDRCQFPWLAGRLRPLLAEAGFETEVFRTETRLDLDGHAGPDWARFATGRLVADGIGAGTLYGFNPFVTAIVRRP